MCCIYVWNCVYCFYYKSGFICDCECDKKFIFNICVIYILRCRLRIVVVGVFIDYIGIFVCIFLFFIFNSILFMFLEGVM